MNHATFVARVDECLDERRDPLDDAEVQAYLLEHPEHLDAIAELRACLRTVGTVAAPPARRRSKRFVAPAAVVAAAAAIALVMRLVRSDDDTVTRPVSHIFTSTLRELTPRAHVAVAFEIRETLAASSSTHVVVYERRSEPR
ncbi:MAG: hypothetical protein JNK78_09520 [Planctomycetes bacterium]|nr:hypothetical protein [Planctomycetota bacterium]